MDDLLLELFPEEEGAEATEEALGYASELIFFSSHSVCLQRGS